jgi:hypothetical protein
MGRLPNWLLVAAVGLLVALAAADALRSTGTEEARTEPQTTATRADLEGVLLIADAGCSVTAVRFPAVAAEEPPRRPDCGGSVWSADGTLVAQCREGVTAVHNEGGELIRRMAGCSPAWRADGSVGVLSDGALVIARSVFRPVVIMTRSELHTRLAHFLPGPSAYEFVAFDWIGTSRFAAVVRGGRLEDQALLVFTMDGELEISLTGLGRLISSVRASPLGNYLAITTNTPERGFTLLTREGERVPLPRATDVRALAWSPDERWIALATRTNVVVARTGSREAVATLPIGGEALEWLP